MNNKLLKFVIVSTLTFITSSLKAQFYSIEIQVDSSKQQSNYTNVNPRGVDLNTLDSNARLTGNYPRGFFPNQKINSNINNKDSLLHKPKNSFLKKEEDEE